VSASTDPHVARDRSLDSLRGLAILFVLIGHFLIFAPYSVGGTPLSDWVKDFGHGGVLLFFMLSGYLIWTKGTENAWPVFLLRRFAKIAPAYWVNVILVALAGATLPLFPAFGWRDTVGNLLFLGGGLGIQPLSGVYWTLVVEVKFYALFALLFYGPPRRLFWVAPFAAVALNLTLFAALGRSSTFLVYLPVFFIGAAIAASDRGRLPAAAVPAIAAAAMLGLALAAPFRGWQAAIFLAVDILLFVWMHRRGIAERRLAWLGVVSYSVYLYHTTLGYPLLDGLSGHLPWPAALAATLLAVAGASWLSFHHVEQRFVRIARTWERPRGASAPVAANDGKRYGQ
jgi:peptidoglycan/LPS O-acetylase OafA/YrhL